MGNGNLIAGPVADQPVRLRTPPGVGTPLRADGRPDQRHPLIRAHCPVCSWGVKKGGHRKRWPFSLRSRKRCLTPTLHYKEPLRSLYCRLCGCLFLMTKPILSNIPLPLRQRLTVWHTLVGQSPWIQLSNCAGSSLSGYPPDPPSVSRGPRLWADSGLRVSYALSDFFHYPIRSR
jgi:hypothetical protein